MLPDLKRLGSAAIALIALVVAFAGCGSSTNSSGGIGLCPAGGGGPNGCSLPTAGPFVSDYGGLAAGAAPADLTLGPDGNMWFSEQTGGRIGRITPNGQVTEFVEPIPNQPLGIVAGVDGNLWAAGVNALDRLTPSGTFTQFPYPTSAAGGGDIVNGSDGRLWFAEPLVGKIAAATTAGAITEYSLGAGTLPVGMALDPNRSGVWFTEQGANAIGLMQPSGAVATLYTVPTPNSQPVSIVAGPDGALWFTEYNAAKIGRMTTSGLFTEYALAGGSQPNAITLGADGNLWFVELAPNKVVRITPAGVLSEFAIPTTGSGPVGIRPGTGRSLWFTEFNTARIGEVQYF